MANLIKLGAEVLGFKAEATVTAPDSVSDGAGKAGGVIGTGAKKAWSAAKAGTHKASARIASATEGQDAADSEE